MRRRHQLQLIVDGGSCGRLHFRRPEVLITAWNAKDVPGALDAIERALSEGRYVAGWLGYELGYALESRLRPRMPATNGWPLLKFGVFDRPEEGGGRISGRAYVGPMSVEWTEDEYETRFNQIQAYIESGDIYQANLTFRARFPLVGDPFALYERLRQDSNAAYCAYVDDGQRQILSISPELFFAISSDGEITVRPMKGTTARLGDDNSERAGLAASVKDRAENLMIVDLIRNDLGRISEIGSVSVPELFEIESYPTLHTMVSTVRAKKLVSTGVSGILKALFPCGSVTGAPKIRSMEILRDLESSPRNAYCGAIGYFSPDGSAKFNVAIRTITIKGGEGELGIGGGIVHDSVSGGEYAECLLKARFLALARERLQLVETLRFDGVFVRLESHLARMAESAVTFGFCFDDHEVRRVLLDAVQGKTGAQRVRLTLDEAGRCHATSTVLEENPACWTYSVASERVMSTDILLRHKTSWREMYESEARRSSADEVIFLNERGELAEGVRTNIFILRNNRFLTPPLDAGLLNGRLRAELIDQGRALEATLTPADLVNGTVYLGNSLRGLIPAVALGQNPNLP